MRRRHDAANALLLGLANALQAFEEARSVVEQKDEARSTTPTLPTYQPQPGPQTELERTDADEILFGGAAGPGKTTGSIGALRERVKLRGYHAIVFRRSSPELKNAIARAKEIYRDGRSVGRFAFAPFAPAPLARFVQAGSGGTMHFPAWGSTIQFGHCNNDDDYLAHMGQEYDDIIFDEAPDFTRTQYENLISRRRGIINGIVRRVIVTANPPEESQPGNEWIRQKWAPWIDLNATVEAWEGFDEGGLDATGDYQPPRTVRLVGLAERRDEQGNKLPPARSGQVLYVAKNAAGVERFSAEPFVWNGVAAGKRTFIAATLRDNPALLDANPDYVQSLRNLDPVRRQQLEAGDWTVRRGAGTMFRREWFEVVEQAPSSKDVLARARTWDKAATEPTEKNRDPDWTRGLRGARLRDGTILVEHLASCRAAPGKRDALIKATADQDGTAVRVRGPQDPGAAGVTDATAFRKLLDGYIVRTSPVSSNKILRAGPASSMAEPLPGARYGRIKVLRGDWNEAFFAELESFPGGAHDDIVDALSDLHDELINHTSAEAAPPPPPPPLPNVDAQSLGI